MLLSSTTILAIQSGCFPGMTPDAFSEVVVAHAEAIQEDIRKNRRTDQEWPTFVELNSILLNVAAPFFRPLDDVIQVNA